MAAHGLQPDVVFRHRGPLGPIMRERTEQLWSDGLLPEGSTEEEIVIVRGRRPAAAQSPATQEDHHGRAHERRQ
jgi:release factor glutamine methyltransferase